MIPSWCQQTISIIRPGVKTVRGSEVPDWEHASEPVVITGCSVQPASTSLSLDGRVLGLSDGLTAYIPEGTDVRAGDHILFEGQTYEIQGEPRVWVAPFTRSHIQLNLIRWEG